MFTFKPEDAIHFALSGTGAQGELVIENATTSHALYKIKTNAADRYIVKPHVAWVAPGERKVVSCKSKLYEFCASSV
jgi:hypothetical protein